MLVTIERPSAARITERAWDSFWQALPWITPLLLVSFALKVGSDFAITGLHEVLNVPTDDALKIIAESGTSLSVAASLPTLGIALIEDILRALIRAPVAVAMHRFILLGEVRRFQALSWLTLRFAAWIFAFEALGTPVNWILNLDHSIPIPATVVVSILGIGLSIIAIRILLLYPAVAVGEKNENISSQIEIALHRGDGIFWLTIGSFVLAFLPILAANILVGILLGEFTKPSTITQIWLDLSNTVAIALGAAVASYLYSYAAHRAATAASS